MVQVNPVLSQGPRDAQCDHHKRTPASEGADLMNAHAELGEGKRIRECIQTMCTLDHRFCQGAIALAFAGPQRGICGW